MKINKMTLLLILICVVLGISSCTDVLEPDSSSAQPSSTRTEDPELSVTEAVPSPTPNYLYSEAGSFQVELGQVFALRWDQSAQVVSENLTIIHSTDIEFECPADAVCEVPLIAADYFEVIKDGESSGLQPWQPEMVIGDYLITTAKFYEGYDYHEHQFEIVLSIERQEAVISAQQTKVAEFDIGGVSSDCGMTLYQFENREWVSTEVHMLAVRETPLGQVDVYLERSTTPMVLVLSAYEPTQWQIHLEEGVALGKVILNGYNPHTILGAEGISIIDHSGSEKNIVESVYTWDTSFLGYKNDLAPDWVYRIEAIAGAPLSTFTGCYRASEFSLK